MPERPAVNFAPSHREWRITELSTGQASWTNREPRKSRTKDLGNPCLVLRVDSEGLPEACVVQVPAQQTSKPGLRLELTGSPCGVAGLE